MAHPLGHSGDGDTSVNAPPSYNDTISSVGVSHPPPHTNAVIEAGNIRARDEQAMQNMLQDVQLKSGIYNSDIEPEHDSDFPCNCIIHRYRNRKLNRLGVQEMWSRAVMYPGQNHLQRRVSQVVSPYGPNGATFGGVTGPQADYYTLSVQQTIQINASLNTQAQASVDAKEPPFDIWKMNDEPSPGQSLANSSVSSRIGGSEEDRIAKSPTNSTSESSKQSRFGGLKKALKIKSSEEKWYAKGRALRNEIIKEEAGRWPNQQWRQIVAAYQDKVGMTQKIASLRVHQPLQYLHLLRAGYFEPIPIAWANLASNPLKFLIDAPSGWRGITPSWRGYEDTAEERLYWVLNHREGSTGVRMKPDFISAMEMAQARMASAIEPPPAYFSATDTCHVQHTSEGYSRQVMPAPFTVLKESIYHTDDTMILLDVSGSMSIDPIRPNYKQYLITGYSKATQPKNKDVAKAIIRRFTDALINHDHNSDGYQLVTFSSQSDYIGLINHDNFDAMWKNIAFGGQTRVMSGWQKVKDLHFQQHSESATFHSVYGWQAGSRTPILRLLLLLDGEATDMDEFELDLLGLSWIHVTIFLIGADGCPHHHRHANELQRISEVNPHVSFVDAQGNTPERFVTHELLKRHLGYDLSITEFEELEHPPSYED
ncbi:hypothetical protein ARAM_006080 [Aspergillus rambellii]|uniref:VWFA domain-containing protein n=1 Tax=Aspergillus rambellii TaxID=308745 RepID=A0A0F8X643_9EURO|nr:hypothetical protein ARAM_006080 [Aspergillus rambellii]